MKYVLLCVIALVVCIGSSLAIALFIKKRKNLSRTVTCFIAVTFSLLIMVVVMLAYLNIYYPAEDSAKINSQTVKMEKIDGGYFFDGPGEDTALIFYPGAKVETTAYAPLMTALAENGVDCFLADFPFRMAMFDSNRADKFINAYSYEKWIAAGHSLGGVVISGYAASHSDEISSLVLLASYPGKKIPDNISLYSVYGTKDGCLGMEAYNNAKDNWPASSFEFPLEGGNHSQYANYGPQSGDKSADISREEQQALTVDIILKAAGK